MTDALEAGERVLDVEPDTLLGAVRWLCATSAADTADVDRAAALLVAALLDLQAYQRGDHDPRRRRTLELAERIQRARDAGVSVAYLRERFKLSRATVYRLLSLKTCRDTSVVQSPAVKATGETTCSIR